MRAPGRGKRRHDEGTRRRGTQKRKSRLHRSAGGFFVAAGAAGQNAKPRPIIGPWKEKSASTLFSSTS